jgi:bifunctional non-homologous end joining protein LigD
VPTLVLDGEVCAFDAKLVSHLHLLVDPDEFATPPVFIAFDCLYVSRRDLRREPLSTRRRALEDETVASGVFIARRLSRDGLEAWEDVKERGCEGMVAKSETAPYNGGRSQAWQKVKVRSEDAFYVLGVRESHGSFAGIVVGAEAGSETNYVGIVEYGFGQRALAELLTRARPLVRRQAPFPGAPDLNVLWLEPKLVALVTYLEQVSGRLREPVYRGLIESA